MPASLSGRQPFIEHLHELRRRLFWSLGTVAIGAAAGYQLHQQLMDILLRPYGQKLYYSSLTGGLDFLIRICLFFGILVAIPVVTYNLLRFIEPVMKHGFHARILKLLGCSVALAVAGIMFAYFVCLPAAVQFLSNFGGGRIQALVSTDQYLNFVMIYLAGFAAIFQLPLILLFINHVTPLPPRTLMKQQRIFIVASFVAAAIITPTPDAVNMAIMALPMILLYQGTILVIWLRNRARKGPVELAPEPAPVAASRAVGVLDLTRQVPAPRPRPPANLLDLRAPSWPTSPPPSHQLNLRTKDQ
ncbi:MAG TPA: twin-arginine translocase subunit TatC [Candidatus Saccharimonadia bacterium]|nr:twin-arginine translocase subunit TatC [Candidatus Saccharimonadia bacterium]